MMQIIIKSGYAHINSSFKNWDTPTGVRVRNREHYERLLKEQGMVSFEQAQEMAANKKCKEYKVSDESLAIIEAAKQSKDSKGNIKLGDRAIEALIAKKAIGRKVPDYMKLPTVYQNKGGFS